MNDGEHQGHSFDYRIVGKCCSRQAYKSALHYANTNIIHQKSGKINSIGRNNDLIFAAFGLNHALSAPQEKYAKERI